MIGEVLALKQILDNWSQILAKTLQLTKVNDSFVVVVVKPLQKRVAFLAFV